jgi:hypothetical protein
MRIHARWEGYSAVSRMRIHTNGRSWTSPRSRGGHQAGEVPAHHAFGELRVERARTRRPHHATRLPSPRGMTRRPCRPWRPRRPACGAPSRLRCGERIDPAPDHPRQRLARVGRVGHRVAGSFQLGQQGERERLARRPIAKERRPAHSGAPRHAPDAGRWSPSRRADRWSRRGWHDAPGRHAVGTRGTPGSRGDRVLRCR